MWYDEGKGVWSNEVRECDIMSVGRYNVGPLK